MYFKGVFSLGEYSFLFLTIRRNWGGKGGASALFHFSFSRVLWKSV